MKKVYFLFVAILFCQTLSAQKDSLDQLKNKTVSQYLASDNTTDTTRANVLRKRLYIGLLGSPDYSFRTLSMSGSDSTQKSILNYRNAHEMAKFSFTAGLDVLYQFNTRFSMSIGFQFSIKGEKTNSLPLTQVNINPSTGLPKDSTLGTVVLTYNTTYVDIPVKLNYYLAEGKRAMYLMAGISPNIYIHEVQIADIKLNNGVTSTNKSTGGSGYYFVNPQAQIGVGFDCAFPASRLRIEPVFRMSFAPVNDGPIAGYFYSVGLNLSYLFLAKN